MSAVEPEAPKPQKKKYRVTGPFAVFGVEPGQTFERTVPLEQEARLLASGAITESAAKKVDAKKADQTPVTTPEKE